MMAGCIPVYWGADNCPEPAIINPKAIVFYDPLRPEKLSKVRDIIEKLYKEFREDYQAARQTEQPASSNGESKLSLWPESMRHFLDRELHKHFEVKAYILDPA